MEKLNIEIVTPEGVIFSGAVEQVTLPGAEGEFGVLPGHSSVVSLLTAGIIDIHKEDGKVENVAIDSGYAEVSSTGVTILAEGAVAVVGKDGSEIAQAIDAAKTLLRGADSSSVSMASLEAKIESAAKAYI
ncbi:MAG: ATP synthase F1 subunit epsilon [Campylobacterales bacterium]|nr:ATP synthase F1 subunit epsilon [Campylobacterales bacterium]